MNHFSSPLSPRLALCSYTQGQASVESCAQASSQPSFYIRRETLPEASQPCGPGQPWGMVSEIKGPIFPKDLFPQVPVPQMQFAGEGYMFLSELIGLAVLISSLETCIQQLYTCLLSHKMQLTGVIVIRCVKVGRQSCAWKQDLCALGSRRNVIFMDSTWWSLERVARKQGSCRKAVCIMGKDRSWDSRVLAGRETLGHSLLPSEGFVFSPVK